MIQAAPDHTAKLQAQFDDQLPAIWQKHSIDAIGFWTALIGASSDELTYMLQESLADFETSWAVLLSYPVWHKVRDTSEADGSIAPSTSDQIPARASFLAFN
jgi:hypothetical protein